MGSNEFTDNEGRWLSVALAAQETGYSHEYIRQLARKKRLPSRFLAGSYFVRPADIQAHMAAKPQRKPRQKPGKA